MLFRSHSLLALRLLSGMEKAFGISLPVGAVFLRPTLAGLAEALGTTNAPNPNQD